MIVFGFRKDQVSHKTAIKTWIVITYHDKILMDKICKYGKIHWNISPVCNNWDLYKRLKTISKNKWVEFGLMIWISYAEWHIGANYASSKCKGYNNRSGIKRRKNDDGSIDKPKLPDSNGCWIYKFDTIEDYWNSFANSIKMWYIDKQCATPECISQHWVRSDWLVKGTWSRRVKMFMNNF